MGRNLEQIDDRARAVVRAFLVGRLGKRLVEYLDTQDVLAISATRENSGWQFLVAVRPPEEDSSHSDGLVDEQRGSSPIFLMSLSVSDDSDDFVVDRLHPE
ncbi:MAG: hypothetical protein ABEN55_10125, partial [Bradymonadaceae bacterium]